MCKKILALFLTLTMLLSSMVVLAIPASALPPAEQKLHTTKGYLLSVHAGSTTANGLSVVYFLSDGTFIIYDGGGSNHDAKHLYDQLRAIADEHGVRDIVVSLWIVTHAHSDHFGMFGSWGNYKDRVEVKEFWFNHWSNSGTNKTYLDQIHATYPGVPVNKVYAGEKYNYADAELLVLYAADEKNQMYYNGAAAYYTDHYGTNTGSGWADFNDSSYIIKMTIGDTSIMMTGDAGWAPFEYVYNSDLRDEMDADIFQVPHHGVGSASVGAKYGTVNNKHLAVISPNSIIVPAGRTVTNMVLSGSRAIREKVKQLDGTWDYDGLYGLYIDFGVVEAAGGMGATIASEADYKAIQTDGEKYWLAGWLNPSDYENTKSAICFFTNVDDRVYENVPQMSDTLVARVDVEAGQKGCGIRYTSRVFAGTVEVLNTLKSEGAITGYSFGTVIFEDEDVAAAADPTGMVTAESLKAAGREYVDVPAVNGISTKKDEDGKIYYEFRAALVNIKSANVEKKFAAVSYIQYTLVSGETVRTYTMYDGEDRSGSMKDVAFMSLADLKTSPSVVDGYKFENPVTYTYQLVGKQYRKSTLQAPMYSAYDAQEWLLLEAYLQ